MQSTQIRPPQNTTQLPNVPWSLEWMQSTCRDRMSSCAFKHRQHWVVLGSVWKWLTWGRVTSWLVYHTQDSTSREWPKQCRLFLSRRDSDDQVPGRCKLSTMGVTLAWDKADRHRRYSPSFMHGRDSDCVYVDVSAHIGWQKGQLGMG